MRLRILEQVYSGLAGKPPPLFRIQFLRTKIEERGMTCGAANLLAYRNVLPDRWSIRLKLGNT
jgi:hypothetical protein